MKRKGLLSGGTGDAVARGATTVAVAQIACLAIQFVGDACLARLLKPEMFGKMALVLAIGNFAALFKDFGLSAAVIQSKNVTEQQSFNLFWVNLSLGCVLTLIISLSSLAFWSNSEVALLLQVASSAFIFSGAVVQYQAILNRGMRLSAMSAANIASILGAYSLSVIWAAYTGTIWSLVVLSVAKPVLLLMFLILTTGWIPKIPKRNAGTVRFLKFGAFIGGFDIVNYFSRNLDKLILANYDSYATAGYYQRAYQLLLLPVAQLRAPLMAACLPVMSNPATSSTQYREIFLGSLNVLASFAIPVATIFFIQSKNVVLLIFGPQWQESAHLLAALSLAVAVQPTVGMLGTVLISLGQKERYLVWGVMNALAVTMSFILGFWWGGAFGVALSYGIVNVITAIPSAAYCLHKSKISVHDFCKCHSIPIIFSLLGGLLDLAYSNWGQPKDSSLVDFLARTSLFLIIYCSQFLLMRTRSDEIWRLIKVLSGR